MKRKLAQEALYSVEHYDSHHSASSENDDTGVIRIKRPRKPFDPDGSKGLALLKEIESQQK